MISADQRRDLRRRIRQSRRELSGEERIEAERSLIRHLRALPAFRSARNVASFRAFDGEPDLQRLSGFSGSKRFYLPVLRNDSLRFASWTEHAAWSRNRFGILEPVGARLIDVRSLDLVLTPLVACDAHGTRLGVGRGYYDRCFSFLRFRDRWLHPKLVGVCFAFQVLDRLEPATWDVPLWGVVTENGATRFNRGA